MYPLHSSAESLVAAGDYDKLIMGLCVNCFSEQLIASGGCDLVCEYGCLEPRVIDESMLLEAMTHGTLVWPDDKARIPWWRRVLEWRFPNSARHG
jgi:hypothetical protein